MTTNINPTTTSGELVDISDLDPDGPYFEADVRDRVLAAQLTEELGWDPMAAPTMGGRHRTALD